MYEIIDNTLCLFDAIISHYRFYVICVLLRLRRYVTDACLQNISTRLLDFLKCFATTERLYYEKIMKKNILMWLYVINILYHKIAFFHRWIDIFVRH